MIDVILLSAGVGTRMGLNYPKQFMKVKGKPIFIYSLEVFSANPKIGKIILVCHPDCLDIYKKYVDMYHIPRVEYILGGSTRQQSVCKAIPYVSSSEVIIHEAARPMISQDLVNELLSAEKADAIVPTVPVKFTVIQGGEYMTGELDRALLHNVQLPQLFKTSVLADVHKKALLDNYHATEDGMMAFHYGYTVKLIPGRESNIKVTTPLDVEIVNNFLNF